MRYRVRRFFNWVCDTQEYATLWVGPPDFINNIFMYDVHGRCFVFFRRIFIVVGTCTPEKDVV